MSDVWAWFIHHVSLQAIGILCVIAFVRGFLGALMRDLGLLPPDNPGDGGKVGRAVPKEIADWTAKGGVLIEGVAREVGME